MSESGKGEFGRIRAYFAPLTDSHPDSFALRDDASKLAIPADKELVVTTDTIVATVHYIGTERPEDIAAKALRVNLSDLAAKGAKPFAYTLNLALPSSVEDVWVERFANGLAQDQHAYGIRLIGGDSVSTPGPVTVTVTAFGLVDPGRYMARTGGRPGDRIYVSGTIGDGALGLLAVRGQLMGAEAKALENRYLRPLPRIGLGQSVVGIATACMDVSDGLVGDLSALAGASGCSALIRAHDVPLSPAAQAFVADDPSLFEVAITGGDDYELLIAVPPDKAKDLEGAAEMAECPVTCIGELTKGGNAGTVDVHDRDGKMLPLSATGYKHA